LFNKVLADGLPLHRPEIDDEVRLEIGATPIWGPLYSRAELVVLKEWLEENMTKGIIRQSPSPGAASILFAQKPSE